MPYLCFSIVKYSNLKFRKWDVKPGRSMSEIKIYYHSFKIECCKYTGVLMSIKSGKRKRVDRHYTHDVDDIFYTPNESIDKIIKHMAVILPNCNTIVDFSCGDNRWITSLLKVKSSLKWFACDIQPPENVVLPCVKKDWFKISKIPLKNIDIVGLNPPFGFKGSIARNFIERAVNLCSPRYLTLVIPYFMNDWVADDYSVLLDVPIENKYVRENEEINISISTHFVIWERSEGTIYKIPEKPVFYLTTLNMAEVYRKKHLPIPLDCILIRYTGYRAGKEVYIYESREKVWKFIRGDYPDDIISVPYPDVPANAFLVIKRSDCKTYRQRKEFFKNIYEPLIKARTIQKNGINHREIGRALEIAGIPL